MMYWKPMCAEHSILPSDKREIAMLTTQFLSSSHFSSMMLDRFQSEIDHLHSCTTIHRISPIELNPEYTELAYKRIGGEI